MANSALQTTSIHLANSTICSQPLFEQCKNRKMVDHREFISLQRVENSQRHNASIELLQIESHSSLVMIIPFICYPSHFVLHGICFPLDLSLDHQLQLRTICHTSTKMTYSPHLIRADENVTIPLSPITFCPSIVAIRSTAVPVALRMLPDASD